MILIENAEVMGFEQAFRGMRNPMNSWDKSDSNFYEERDFDPYDYPCRFKLGSNDLELMLKLAKAGPVHAKYRRMITVYADITAPLYWWKEFDTYKVGTVANSCSTMHKIHAKEFTLDDFSHEDLLQDKDLKWGEVSPIRVLDSVIHALNVYRDIYNELSKIDKEAFENAPKIQGITNDSLDEAKKRAWKQMVQLLPSSYNQKRTVMFNYEVLSNITHYRDPHKLDEWVTLCKWIETLPYSEIIKA